MAYAMWNSNLPIQGSLFTCGVYIGVTIKGFEFTYGNVNRRAGHVKGRSRNYSTVSVGLATKIQRHDLYSIVLLAHWTFVKARHVLAKKWKERPRRVFAFFLLLRIVDFTYLIVYVTAMKIALYFRRRSR